LGLSEKPYPKTMKGYYQLRKTSSGKFHFTLNAGNHEPILSSQQYSEKRDAEDGIEATRANGTHEARYVRKLSAAGEPYFLLKAANSEIIGTSEIYGSEASRDNGIHSVVNHCTSTQVKDFTESA
jgi:uncharacterized protein YegP (UPF0339 family)